MVSVAGGHWALLQVVAWAQMLHAYSQNGDVVEAVAKTFDGDHPCELCRKVTEGRQREEKAPATRKVNKKETVFAVAATETLRPPLAGDFLYPCSGEDFFSRRGDPPPGPVPRARIVS